MQLFSVLEDLAFKGHLLPKYVLEWRQLSKSRILILIHCQRTLMNPKTNKLHTSFLLAATSTGRLASSDPNLQNIPIKTNDGNDIRKAFVAEKVKVLSLQLIIIKLK